MARGKIVADLLGVEKQFQHKARSLHTGGMGAPSDAVGIDASASETSSYFSARPKDLPAFVVERHLVVESGSKRYGAQHFFGKWGRFRCSDS